MNNELLFRYLPQIPAYKRLRKLKAPIFLFSLNTFLKDNVRLFPDIDDFQQNLLNVVTHILHRNGGDLISVGSFKFYKRKIFA